MSAQPTIVLSSGEMSGDLHAGRLIARVREQLPGARILALGGERCSEAGAELLFHYRDFAILGFTGVLMQLPRLMKLERVLKREIKKADLFVAVDYPGLNLRLAQYAKKCGVPVLYYISPQVWAWGAGRIDKMARSVDRLAVILPFEEALFKDRGLAVEFVGHPFVVDHELPEPVAQDQREGIGLLPGSRLQEVQRILPTLLQTSREIRERMPNARFTVGKSEAVARSEYEAIIGGDEVTISDDPIGVMRRSRLLLVASGTATLQGALMETPLIVVYKVSAMNYFLARRLVQIENIGLVNVVLGDRVAPEFIQGDADPRAIAREGVALLEDDTRRAAMVTRFRSLRDTLAGGGGCTRVAQMITELIVA